MMADFTAQDAMRGAAKGHRCHNCCQPLPAKYVMHPKAWFKVPKRLRDAIWLHYRRGQEIDKSPSPEYIAALREVLRFCREHNVSCQRETR